MLRSRLLSGVQSSCVGETPFDYSALATSQPESFGLSPEKLHTGLIRIRMLAVCGMGLLRGGPVSGRRGVGTIRSYPFYLGDSFLFKESKEKPPTETATRGRACQPGAFFSGDKPAKGKPAGEHVGSSHYLGEPTILDVVQPSKRQDAPQDKKGPDWAPAPMGLIQTPDDQFPGTALQSVLNSPGVDRGRPRGRVETCRKGKPLSTSGWRRLLPRLLLSSLS
jgi:hypothetical protein